MTYTTNSFNWLKNTVKNNQKLLSILLRLFFFFCIYKMNEISKEEYEKCEVEIIDKGRYFWVNRRDLEIESDYKYWAQIFDKCGPERQTYRQQLTSNAECQWCRVFVPNDLVERKFCNSKKS